MSKPIPPDVLDVLGSSTVEGNILKLPEGQLPRDQYAAVNKVIEAMGGKWNRGKQGHLFADDPSDVLDTVLSTGVCTDTKIELQQFFTPLELARQLVKMAEFPKEVDYPFRALEPSAGIGNIALMMKAAMPVMSRGERNVALLCVEIAEQLCGHLAGTGLTSHRGDFLQLTLGLYHRIVMNPPFARQQDVDHVTHAIHHLSSDGILVAVMSPGWMTRDNTRSSTFRGLLAGYRHVVEDLPPGSFKASGTMVNAVVLKVWGPDA
jgi:hypothetical protein